MEYLNTTAWLYKYPFYDQLLIYAQRPDARACAPIPLWNNTFKRWVNKGAKGIALIDDSGERSRLRYVFDVSDTNTRSDIPVRIWDIQPRWQAQITEELGNRFGEVAPGEPFEQQLLSVVQSAVIDNIGDYVDTLAHMLDDSMLSGLPYTELKDVFCNTVYGGVAYSVLTRAGIQPGLVLPMRNFLQVEYFNTPAVVSQLGCATSDISEMILRQMERSVRSIERQERDNIAIPEKQRDNVAIQDRNEAERSEQNGIDLHTARRLHASRPTDGRAVERDAGQIRQDAEELFEATSQREIQRDAAHGESDGTPSGDRQDGTAADGADRTAVGDSAGSERSTESIRSDGVGAADEQHPALGGGVDTGGADLQLIPSFPTEAEQMSLIEQAEENKTSAFSLPQAEIDRELLRGSGFQHGKFRIHRFYQTQPNAKDAVAFLKKEYGIGGHSHTFLDGSHGFIDHDGKGLTFKRWDNDQSITVSWSKVHRRLSKLVAQNRYLTAEEAAFLPTFEKEEADRQERRAEETAAREARREAAEAMDERRKHAEYRFSLGDEALLGDVAYTVVGIEDETITLNDPHYPLIQEDMARDLFERRLRENAENDHLIVEDDSDALPVSGHETAAPEAQPDADIPLPALAIGEIIEHEGRRYAVESVGERSDDVTLRDLTFESEAGFPISRIEKTDTVLQWLSEQKTAITHEDVPTPLASPQPKRDFRITDDTLGHGGAKAKFRMNVDAIRTLQTIEAEQRMAMPEEQKILSRYVGWGGLADAFDETNPNWQSEYAELRGLLPEAEYESARASTLNAHYTSPTVIRAMYEAIERMGFATGNILEPACGIGNFFGLVPDSMKGSRLYGIELDSITGRIAKQLYQNANIEVQGFEETSLPDSFFDLAIGNVPFGDYGVSDRQYDKHHFLIHDYFFGATRS
jgi:hypothetical protein